MTEQKLNKLIFNYILDMRKKEIDGFERAFILRQYLTDEKISIRELARQTNLKRSTIEDWLRWEKLDSTQYEEMKGKGLTDTDIYRILRTSKRTKNEKILQIDMELERLINNGKIYKLGTPYSEKTIDLLDKSIVLLQQIRENIRAREYD